MSDNRELELRQRIKALRVKYAGALSVGNYVESIAWTRHVERVEKQLARYVGEDYANTP